MSPQVSYSLLEPQSNIACVLSCPNSLFLSIIALSSELSGSPVRIRLEANLNAMALAHCPSCLSWGSAPHCGLHMAPSISSAPFSIGTLLHPLVLLLRRESFWKEIGCDFQSIQDVSFSQTSSFSLMNKSSLACPTSIAVQTPINSRGLMSWLKCCLLTLMPWQHTHF